MHHSLEQETHPRSLVSAPNPAVVIGAVVPLSLLECLLHAVPYTPSASPVTHVLRSARPFLSLRPSPPSSMRRLAVRPSQRSHAQPACQGCSGCPAAGGPAMTAREWLG